MSLPIDFKLNLVEFPEPAGTYQREGRATALVRELGDNYATYHEFLRVRLAAHAVDGRRPERSDFPDKKSFYAVYADIQETLRAEVILRSCRSFLLDGRRLDTPYDPSVPLIDENDRLVSVE